jgi:hypothetical protein
MDGKPTRRKTWRVIYPYRVTPWVPAGPHVYAIYLDGELAYIGSSQDLSARFGLYKFRQAGEGWSCCIRGEVFQAGEIAVKIKLCRKYGSWLMAEARLIRRLRPRLNRIGLGLKGGEPCRT